MLSASLVSEVHRYERSWWPLFELLWLLVAVSAIKVRVILMMLTSLLKLLLLSLSKVRVFVGDTVGAEVGIATGGGAGRVDNADGV